jgi:hypothetical protein
MSWMSNSCAKPLVPGGRRRLRRAALPAAWIAMIAVALACRGGEQRLSPARPARRLAISLRNVLREPTARGTFNFFRGTWLRGVLSFDDARGKDCVLLVDIVPGRPLLRADDFAVAYRNVTQQRQRPACTIDPRADTLKELRALSSKIASANTAVAVQMAEFARLAQSLQDVRVFGVEAKTHVASVMVSADYFLKSVCNGTEKIEGLTSLFDLRIQEMRVEMQKANPGAAPMSLNRFWFNPGKSRYQTNAHHSLLLGKCPVILLTEAEAVTPQGKQTGLGKTDPLARQFAQRFTDKYQDIAKAKPLYAELENLYRWVALADLLSQQAKKTGHGELVERFVRAVYLPDCPTPASVPGKQRTERMETAGMKNGRQTIGVAWLVAVGGVSIDVHMDPVRDRDPDPAGYVAASENAVLAARPSANATWWAFSGPDQ